MATIFTSRPNLATDTILSGIDNHAPGQGLGINFPYLKFAWEIRIGNASDKKDLSSTPPLVAKTVELPRWSTDTQIINVYNHKTIVQTKLNWEPMTISLYDQANGVADCLIWEFVKGQFDAPNGSKAAKHTPLEIELTMKNLSGDGDAKDKIYKLGGVYIIDAQHDSLDYSASDPVLWTITVRFETLEVEEKDCQFSGTVPVTTPKVKPPAAKPDVVAMPQNRRMLEDATSLNRVPSAARAEYNKPKPTPPQSIGARILGALGWPQGNTTGSSNSPSAGVNSPATTTVKKERTPYQQSFIDTERLRIQDSNFTPAYKEAYMKSLEANPPLGTTVARDHQARTQANKAAMRAAHQHDPQNPSPHIPRPTYRATITTSSTNPGSVADRAASLESKYRGGQKIEMGPNDY